MNAPDTRHVLAPDLALLAPPAFAVRSGALGLAGIEAETGARLSILLKSSASGEADAHRLHESAIALVQKKHANVERIGVPAPILAVGCSGRTELLHTSTAANASIHIVVTTLIVPDTVNTAQQRNLIVVLEVPTPVFGQRAAYYQRFAQDRLRIGSGGTMPLVPELAPTVRPPRSEPAVVEDVVASAPARTAATVASVSSPAFEQVAERGEDELLLSAAHGQRTLAISIVLTFIARAIGNVPDVPVFLAHAMSAAVLFYAISGVLSICSGFRYSLNRKLVLMFCSSVPLIGIVCWVYLSIRTTRRLRAAGYQVGLFGVRA